MIQFSGLIYGFVADVYTQAAEEVFVHFGKDHRGVGVASVEIVEHIHGFGGAFIGGGADGQSNEGFIGVEAGVVVAHVVHFEVLNGFDHFSADKFHFFVDACQMFQGVE